MYWNTLKVNSHVKYNYEFQEVKINKSMLLLKILLNNYI